MDTLLEVLTPEVKQELQEAYKSGNFKWIDDVGFFTYWEIRKENKLYVFVNNLYIDPDYRSKKPLFWIRNFLKEKYRNKKVEFWYSHEKKRNRFFYMKG